MGEAAERDPEVPGKRPHIGALAATRLDHAMVGIRHVNEREAFDQSRPRGKLEILLVPGEVVGPGASYLQRRIARWHLADLTNEAWQRRLDLRERGVSIARRHDRAICVVSVGGCAEAHREAVLLVAFYRERHGLGRFAEGDGQHSGGERVERAGVTRLLRAIEVPHPRYGLRRGHALRLVQHEPAMDGETFAPPRHLSAPRQPSRSRASEASSSPMRWELANEVSVLKRSSGMNVRFTRRASLPLRKRLCLSRCLTAPSPPSGSTKTVASFKSGVMRTSDTVSEN